MHVLDANELFGVTSYTYDRIMEEGGKNGPDAFALYFKLMKQARIQETNQTFTLNQFLKNFFGWGHERLAKAKNVLKKLGLVDDVLIRSDDGKLQGHYIRVNYLVDEQKVRTSALTYNLTDSLENRQSVSTECGQTDANALNTKLVNAGNTQLKYSEKKIPSVSELVEAYRGTPELVRKINDDGVVKQRAEYKQAKKSTAYKSIRGFIQQLVENVTTVSNGEIRYDVGERLSYAQTKCIDGGCKGIWWNDQMEKGFETWKKFNSITNKQNE